MSDVSELISACLEGHLTAEQAEEMKTWLSASPDNADQFARESFLHSYTRDLFATARARRQATPSGHSSQPAHGTQAPQGTQATRGTESARRVWWQRPIIWAAAAVLLVTAGLLFAVRRPGPTAAVATLLNPAEIQWEVGGGPPAGVDLMPGPLALHGGTARLRFAGGAQVEVTGPARFELQSGASIRLQEGRLTAVVGPPAAGFTVRTPSATVIDLGTEFAVVVEPSGASETYVYRGTVKVCPSGGGLEKLLSTKDAARVEAGGKLVALIPFRPRQELPPEAGPPEQPPKPGPSTSAASEPSRYFALPQNWQGSQAGSATNNPVLVDGKPRWRFDRVWPDDPLVASHYVPLVWGLGRWTGADHAQGEHPSISIVGSMLEMGTRGPWGTGKEGSTDPGGKWPALVFIAPCDGRYTLQGDARFIPGIPPQAVAHLLVLRRDPQASSVALLKDMELNRSDDEQAIEHCEVILKAGEELVVLGQVRLFNNLGTIKIRDFKVARVGE